MTRLLAMFSWWSALLMPGVISAASPWPAEAHTAAMKLPELDPYFSSNMSGAYWNASTRTFWVCCNGPGTFWALVENGSGGWKIATDGGGTKARWEVGGDFEAICQTDNNESAVYVMDENSSIRKFDVSSNGVVNEIRAWNISAECPETRGQGPEGLTFVPDAWLGHEGFRDGGGVLRTSSNGMGGLMFVGHQTGGYVHVFDLNPNTSSYTYYGKLQTSREEVADLHFDRETGKFYLWHNTGPNYFEVAELNSYVVGNERRFRTLIEYLGPRSGNLEGMALVFDPLGADWILLTDDSNEDDEAVTLYEQFSPEVDTDSDGLIDDWELMHLGSTALTAGALDFDGDGVLDVTEFAFGGDPLNNSDSGRVYTFGEDLDADAVDDLVLTLAVRLGTPVFAGSPSPTASHDGITYTIEGSHDLVDYTAVVEPVLVPATAGLPPPGDGYEFRSFRLAGSTALMEQGFLRAKVTQP